MKYANTHGLPFLAVNRGHGSTKTLGILKHGIEIRIRTLDEIRISPGGASAFMQGGVYGDQVISTLWDAGYVTSKSYVEFIIWAKKPFFFNLLTREL